MTAWRDTLRHAFAVEKAEDFEPTPEQVAVAEKVCRWVVRRQLTTVAHITLEAHRGLNFIGSQAMHFFKPAVEVLADAQAYQHFAEFLEHRGSIDWLCRRMDELEDACESLDDGMPTDEFRDHGRGCGERCPRPGSIAGPIDEATDESGLEGA